MPTFTFELKHKKHGVAFYGVTSAESRAEAKEHLLERAEQRAASYRESNKELPAGRKLTVVPADELTVSLHEVKR